MDPATLDASGLAAAIHNREISASAIIERTLARIRALDPTINAFTEITEARARSAATQVDALIAAGGDPGPLAGVPFAVKNLFDVAGTVTTAGSIIRRTNPPAGHDATLVRRLCEAGAVLVGVLNMDEFAYGFSTENSHYGPTRNPHDTVRTAGGSSGGSGAAVAAGFVPFTLGSDTGGSIRVPSSLCGLFGLKPTFGRLSRAGIVLFAPSFDIVGPLGRSVRDLALLYDLMQGPDAADPACNPAPSTPLAGEIERGTNGLRLATVGGYFRHYATEDASEALTRIATHLSITSEIELPDPHVARSAAFVIGAVEGASQHEHELRHRLDDFDPNTRCRFLAGALLPAAWYVKAQRYRRWLNDRMAAIFADVDALLTPATPCTATLLGQQTVTLGGETLMARPSLGLFTQPFTLTGLPIVTVPLRSRSGMPIGIQVVAPQHREDIALRIAWQLERDSVAAALINAEP